MQPHCNVTQLLQHAPSQSGISLHSRITLACASLPSACWKEKLLSLQPYAVAWTHETHKHVCNADPDSLIFQLQCCCVHDACIDLTTTPAFTCSALTWYGGKQGVAAPCLS